MGGFDVISQVGSTNGTITGTVATITLPAYTLTDFIVLIVASNNANSQTLGSNVTGTELANAGDRLVAYRIVPVDGSQTSFTLTIGASSVLRWWIASYSGVELGASVASGAVNVGSNTTSSIAIPTVSLDYIATGAELALASAAVNSSAAWTTSAETVFATTSGNAAMMVSAKSVAADVLSVINADLDRGLGGTTRNESACLLVLQATPVGVPILLGNPSFELGTTLATGWEEEHTTVTAATYSLSGTGVVDGTRSQRIQFTGTAGDTGKLLAIYQAPVDAAPGQNLTFDIHVSGSLTNAYGIIGIEAFQAGGAFISATDTPFTSLSGTPEQYSVTYLCPALTDYVAVFVQFPDIAPTSVINVYLDRAALYSPAAVGTHLAVWDGVGWVDKPMETWDGSGWADKPTNRWDGTAWVPLG